VPSALLEIAAGPGGERGAEVEAQLLVLLGLGLSEAGPMAGAAPPVAEGEVVAAGVVGVRLAGDGGAAVQAEPARLLFGSAIAVAMPAAIIACLIRMFMPSSRGKTSLR